MGRHNQRVAPLEHFPPAGCGPGAVSMQDTRRSRPERTDDRRPDEFNLALEVRRAGLYGVVSGFALRDAAFDRSGQVHLVTTQLYGFNNTGQQLSAFAGKGPALHIGIMVRGIADKHEPGFTAAFTEHDMGAVIAQPAAFAVGALFAQ